MDRSEFVFYLNDLIINGRVPEVITEDMREYVQKMHTMEDKLLAEWAYAKASGNDADAQHLADLLGYEPDFGGGS